LKDILEKKNALLVKWGFPSTKFLGKELKEATRANNLGGGKA